MTVQQIHDTKIYDNNHLAENGLHKHLLKVNKIISDTKSTKIRINGDGTHS